MDATTARRIEARARRERRVERSVITATTTILRRWNNRWVGLLPAMACVPGKNAVALTTLGGEMNPKPATSPLPDDEGPSSLGRPLERGRAGGFADYELGIDDDLS